jgi:hypothetical protein
MKEIEEIKEKLTPTNPPEVTDEREQQVALQIEMIEREDKNITKCFDRIVQRWMTLEEDERV